MEEKSFFDRVYGVVRQIPPGCVVTYGQVAALAGNPRSARQVGYAMHTAPPGLPCHRVVNRKGELAPDEVFGGKGRQRELLQKEGISFLENGRIDLTQCRWLG